jgi:hypothetical protein
MFITKVLRPDQLTAPIVAQLICETHDFRNLADLDEDGRRVAVDSAERLLDALVARGILGY